MLLGYKVHRNANELYIHGPDDSINIYYLPRFLFLFKNHLHFPLFSMCFLWFPWHHTSIKMDLISIENFILSHLISHYMHVWLRPQIFFFFHFKCIKLSVDICISSLITILYCGCGCCVETAFHVFSGFLYILNREEKNEKERERNYTQIADKWSNQTNSLEKKFLSSKENVEIKYEQDVRRV